MEQLFRKYFWAVNLAFIFMASLLAARTANLFVEYGISPAAASTTPRTQNRPRPIDALARLDVERLAKLAGLPLPRPDPEVKEPLGAQQVDLSSEPVKCGMRVKLLGALLSGVPEWSFASVQDMVSQKTQTFMPGDSIQGAKVLSVEMHAVPPPDKTTLAAYEARVIVLDATRRCYINADPGTGEIAPPVAVPSAIHHSEDAPPSVALGQGIKALSENQYQVPRAEIDKTLSNLNDVAMQARIVPAFKDGQAEGFKLFSIRPDSIYTKIGIQNGDVIKQINGYDLNSPEKALEIYSKLKESSSIEIVVDRNGSTIHKTYSIQ